MGLLGWGCSAVDVSKEGRNQLRDAGLVDGSPRVASTPSSAASEVTDSKLIRPLRCDSSGRCSCINIGSLGKVAHYGADGNDTTDAFQAWLNSKSSANVLLHQERTPITPEFLANYDVLILQALEDNEFGPFWSFKAAELEALTGWVQDGGGLIALSGYGGDAEEVTPTNQLLAFTGISYNQDKVLTDADCPNGLCYCTDSSVPITGWIPTSPVSANLTAVGGYHGRSIHLPEDATAVVSRGSVVYAASKTVGRGRVFVFADEWVTYTSQWNGKAVTDPTQSCFEHTADRIFEVPQFWYNVIRFVAPAAECFTIEDPTIVSASRDAGL